MRLQFEGSDDCAKGCALADVDEVLSLLLSYCVHIVAFLSVD